MILTSLFSRKFRIDREAGQSAPNRDRRHSSAFCPDGCSDQVTFHCLAFDCLRRKVEVYRVGLYESFDDLDTPPVDPRQLAGEEGDVTALNRIQFDDVWEQSRQMPDGFMGMYF